MSARRSRWKSRSWSWRRCTSIPTGTPPSIVVASSTGHWCRSTPGRPAPSGSATRRAGASPAAWPTLRESKEDNGYARPLEGLLAFVDMGRGEVLEVLDLGVVPLPSEHGSYYPEHNGPLRTDLKPLEIIQPEGPSFEVDGNLVRWQKWSLRIGMDPLEGLVLWTVGYEDGGRIRPIVYRASVSEMVVPYGHPGPMHAWKSAFDAGEWGLGRMANSLTLGCDCLGEIRYFDDVFADERGKPRTRANAICMHEEDYGILWKHVDMVSGRTEVRRSRRLVVSSIATVGNYEYGFYWYFYLDGTMQLEVKLTGIMSTMAVAGGDPGDHARMIAPGLAAPYHQHLFNVRLDMQVDGPDNEVYEVDAVPTGSPGSPENPWGNAFGTTATLLESELEARRDVDAVAQPHLAHRQPVPPERGGAADRLQAAARAPRRRCWPTPPRASGAGPRSHRTTCGSRRSIPRSAEPRGTTPTSTTATPACRPGRRRIVPSSTPTSCCGTPSASPTSRGPRTGRSCRSSTPASRSCRSASSTATPRSTCRPLPTTAMTEHSAAAHQPQEYHPPVEEYLETMLSLSEEGVPVIQARIAERLGRSAPSVSEMLDRLREDGYVTRDGRRLSLTESGQALAEKVVRKHRLAERLLVDVIGLEWHKVHREAGRWEHVISDDVEARLVELLGDPATCPHGNPIPGSHSPAAVDPGAAPGRGGRRRAGAALPHQRRGRIESRLVDAARRGRLHPGRRGRGGRA